MGAGSTRKAFLYYAIALGLALIVPLAVPVVGVASLPLTMLTPSLAVAIMLTVVSPEGTFRASVRSLGLTTAGLKAWPLAIMGPALIQLVSVSILVVAGLTVLVVPGETGSIVGTALKIGTGLFVGTAFALGEEVGWRGYMLPRMLEIGLVPAMLLVGFLHGVWHLPILLTTDYYHSLGNPWIVAPLFLITLTLAGVFYGFLRVWTGSVWPVAIAHAAANMAWGIASELAQTQSPLALEYVGGESGAVMIGSLFILDLLLLRVLRRANFTASARGEIG